MGLIKNKPVIIGLLLLFFVCVSRMSQLFSTGQYKLAQMNLESKPEKSPWQ